MLYRQGGSVEPHTEDNLCAPVHVSPMHGGIFLRLFSVFLAISPCREQNALQTRSLVLVYD